MDVTAQILGLLALLILRGKVLSGSRALAGAAMLVALLASAGCVKKIAINKIGDALASGGATFSSDDDPELIRQVLRNERHAESKVGAGVVPRDGRDQFLGNQPLGNFFGILEFGPRATGAHSGFRRRDIKKE